MAYGLAPGAKTMSATVTPEYTPVGAVSSTPATSDAPNVATSAGPFGTVAGVQFAALFQRFVTGFKFQVALPACSVHVLVITAAMAAIRLICTRIFRSIGVPSLAREGTSRRRRTRFMKYPLWSQEYCQESFEIILPV
jgi:hypothetical protein